MIERLSGKRTGYGEVRRQLEHDPCSLGAPVNPERPKAYRLSGPLQPVVCGTHLRNGYRLAYTTRGSLDDPDRREVVILYVGKKDDPAYGPGNDMWDVIHHLFDEPNPESAHLKLPCCEEDWPEIDHDDLRAFEQRLAAVTRRHSR